jgi:PEP-CTERM motif
LLAAPLVVSASPITYSLTFAVDGLGPFLGPEVCNNQPTTHCVSALGNVYTGYFVVDSSVLATDGFDKTGNLYALSIQMEGNIWAYGVPGNNSLVGFRNANGVSSSPGFDVLDGHIVGLEGGVFGAADSPFVDFIPPYSSSSTPNSYRFDAVGDGSVTNNNAGSYVFNASGVMDVTPVPEPTTLALFGLGLLGVGFLRRRRAS